MAKRGRPRKNPLPEPVEIQEVGVPGLFQPQDWDVEEEMANNDALREFERERQGESLE